jgi:hypothetical protein
MEFNGYHTDSILRRKWIYCAKYENIHILLRLRNVKFIVDEYGTRINIHDLVKNIIILNDLDPIQELLKHLISPYFNVMIALILRFANENTVNYLLKFEHKMVPEILFDDIFHDFYLFPFVIAMERNDDNVEIISKICDYIDFENRDTSLCPLGSALKACIDCNNTRIFGYVFNIGVNYRYIRPYSIANDSVVFGIFSGNKKEFIDIVMKTNTVNINRIINELHYLSESERKNVVNVFVDYEEQGKISIDYPYWKTIKRNYN